MWTSATQGKVRIVAPAGRIDESSATAFADRLAEEIELASGEGDARLVIDLGQIEYMSSRGLRGLTLGQRKGGEHDVTVVLAGGNEIMREILAISRYDKVFQIFGSVEEAVAA